MEKIENIQKYIMDTVCETLDDVYIDIETHLVEEEILDSITILYLIDELEQEYDIKIDLKEVTESNFATVEAISNFVLHKISGK